MRYTGISRDKGRYLSGWYRKPIHSAPCRPNQLPTISSKLETIIRLNID